MQNFQSLNAHSYTGNYSIKEISTNSYTKLDERNQHCGWHQIWPPGFQQMPIHSKVCLLAAFTVPGIGQFERITASVGLRQFMEKLLWGTFNIGIINIDNLLIHSGIHNKLRQVLFFSPYHSVHFLAIPFHSFDRSACFGPILFCSLKDRYSNRIEPFHYCSFWSKERSEEWYSNRIHPVWILVLLIKEQSGTIQYHSNTCHS